MGAQTERSMRFSREQITRITDHRLTPKPDTDCPWWQVDLRGGRPGWVFTDESAPVPSDDWVIDELKRQGVLLGKALEGRLLAPGGIKLLAPRVEEDVSAR